TRLGQVGGDFCDQAAGPDANGTGQVRFSLDRLVQQMGGPQGRPEEPLAAGQIHVCLIDGRHFHLGREAAEDFIDLLGVFAIAVRVPLNKERLRAQSIRRPQRHRRMNTEFAGLIRGRGDYAPFVRPPAHHYGPPLEPAVIELLDGDEEGVHVDVKNGPHGSCRPQPDSKNSSFRSAKSAAWPEQTRRLSGWIASAERSIAAGLCRPRTKLYWANAATLSRGDPGRRDRDCGRSGMVALAAKTK